MRAPASEHTPASSKVVAIVDDDAAVLSSLAFALEMDGLSVRTYQTAEEFAATVDAWSTGCLVLDYHLPGMNGADLLDDLRALGVSVPAILMTSNPSASLRRRADASGVAIIEKPLLGNALVEAIKACLGQA